MTDAADVLSRLRGRLIVSCQAYEAEPMLDPRTMTQVAQSVVRGGAAAVRLKGLEDLRLARNVLDVPIIGLVKIGHEGVYITLTLADAIHVAETGCEIVALDGTRRARPDGLSLGQTISELKARFPEILVMADCGSVQDSRAAASAGADIVATTLAGTTPERPVTVGPDWQLVHEMIRDADRPVFVEGRVRSPEDAAMAIRAGAWSVVVGTAITHPTTMTGCFSQAVESVREAISGAC
ncbi:N-acetylmannosamine-6-phosphate 2-epimerase [Cutibacterium sp. WCA-380-WT-3A]|uniref:N-acylglucosamine-6-phosphate 2-epimerase n=1 Tax=Cutibacterium porci TaxID=2605781 RepID=A0A7K0J5I2_9ACTN|nr:N-acetylmannosamine-6-phosphate 2-epimerase [Cutibacterium porci]MSS45201.1 N-acetylmannosamine-6-phosphate 2-epimerase [Cutibacterium porci]